MSERGVDVMWDAWKAKTEEWTTLANQYCAHLQHIMFFARRNSDCKSTYLVRQSKTAYL